MPIESKLFPFLFCRCDYGHLRIDFDILRDEVVFRECGGVVGRLSFELGKRHRFRLPPAGDYVRLSPSQLKDSLQPETLRLLRYCAREYVFDVVDYRSDEVIFIFDHGRKFYVLVQT